MRVSWSRYTIKMINSRDKNESLADSQYRYRRFKFNEHQSRHRNTKMRWSRSGINMIGKIKVNEHQNRHWKNENALIQIWHSHEDTRLPIPISEIQSHRTSNSTSKCIIESNQIVEHRHQHRIKSNQIIKNNGSSHCVCLFGSLKMSWSRSGKEMISFITNWIQNHETK